MQSSKAHSIPVKLNIVQQNPLWSSKVQYKQYSPSYSSTLKTGSSASWYQFGACLFGGHIQLGDRCIHIVFFKFKIIVLCFCPDTYMLLPPAILFEVDILKALCQSIQKMVLVWIGMQKDGLKEHMTLSKAYIWTDFRVECSVF